MFRISDEFDILTVVAITIPLVLVLITALIDVVRRRDIRIGRKVLWATLIVLTSFVGVAIYFIARPARPPEGKRYGETAPRSSEIVDGLEQLRDRHDAGELYVDAYLLRKRTILGLDTGST